MPPKIHLPRSRRRLLQSDRGRTGSPRRCSPSSTLLCRRPIVEPSQICKEDEETGPTFAALNESRVRQWYEPRSFTLKESMAQRVRGGAIEGKIGRPLVMQQYPVVCM